MNPTGNKLAPLISIVIPLYNSAASLQYCLNSILNQSFRNYEIVFIDGLSTDNTLQIIADFGKRNRDIRVKVVSEPDKGIYDAMNKGIGLASGEWIYFMGSDDTFYSARVLADICQEIKKEKTDLLYGNVYGATSNKGYIYDTLSKALTTGIHHQSVFYKSSLFKQLGNYDLKFKIAADYDFTLKVILGENYRTKYINQDIAYYGEGGYSSKNFDFKFFSGHYKILASQNGISKLEDPKKCLENSIYCCLYLAKEKKNFGFAWVNLWYYLTNVKELALSFRIRTFFRMLMWSIKPS